MEFYKSTLRRSEALYNGSKYYDQEYRTVKGHPNFESENPEFGRLIYDGQYYWNVEMLYNTCRDILVIVHFDERGYYTELIPQQQKVTWFQLLDQTFLRITPDTLSKTTIREGYYNLLYDGDSKVLAKHQKTIETRQSLYSRQEFFKEKTRQFVKVNGFYYQIKGKRSLLKALAGKEKEIKVFLRMNKLKFTDYNTAGTIMAVQYFDSLNTQH